MFANIATVYGLYAQAWKVWRSKSAKDFSWELLTALFAAEVAWLNYGFALAEWPIVSLSVANLPAIIALYVMYRKYTGVEHEKGG